jgi:hypothetical protein
MLRLQIPYTKILLPGLAIPYLFLVFRGNIEVIKNSPTPSSQIDTTALQLNFKTKGRMKPLLLNCAPQLHLVETLRFVIHSFPYKMKSRHSSKVCTSALGIFRNLQDSVQPGGCGSLWFGIDSWWRNNVGKHEENILSNPFLNSVHIK